MGRLASIDHYSFMKILSSFNIFE
uniref:Uncharacterized protein n=1 Tax=Arundo donax TaxID=35708 RepID=A0A0A9C3G7_ARUDO